MYLYALDLSMDNTGIAIFEIKTFRPIYIGSIKTNKKHSHGDRLYQIITEMDSLIKLYPPSEIAIERGFSRFNTATQVIFRVHGVINVLFRKYPQKYFTPKTIKEAILSGSSSKERIEKRIKESYADINFADNDQSDAFAVGLTYFIKEHGMNWEKSTKKGGDQMAKKKPTAKKAPTPKAPAPAPKKGGKGGGKKK